MRLIWNGTRWERLPDTIVEGLAKNVVLTMYSEVHVAGSWKEAGAIAQHAKRSKGQSRIRTLVDSLKRQAVRARIEDAIKDLNERL